MKIIRALGVVLAFAALNACQKGQPAASDELLRKLRASMASQIQSEQELETVNTLVKDVVKEDAIGDLRRFEVEQRLGKGSPCSAHPDCSRLGFSDTDWVYVVGRQPDDGAYFLPMLFVGFDRQGHHARSHYLMREPTANPPPSTAPSP